MKVIKKYCDITQVAGGGGGEVSVLCTACASEIMSAEVRNIAACVRHSAANVDRVSRALTECHARLHNVKRVYIVSRTFT
jgi:hypothetical protein